MSFEDFLEKHGIWHEFLIKDNMHSAASASQASGIPKDSIVKSLVFKAGDGFCLVIIQGSRKASANKLRKLLHEKNVRLASADEVLDVTGYAIGAVPPIGLKNKIKCIIDKDTAALTSAWAGGGAVDRLVHLRMEDIIKYHKPLIEDVGE